jgi:hypothetical protein
MKSKGSRSELEVFAELATLCCRPGYVHAIAYLCFRDNIIGYAEEMTEADMQKMFAPSRLIRTEITTLIGLMVKAPIDWNLPSPETLQQYANDTEQLLEELHYGLSSKVFGKLTREAIADGSCNPFDSGEAMREPIFYGGESAYIFQYYDLAARKYAADAPWLLAHRGFTIAEARAVAKAVEQVQADRYIDIRQMLRKVHPKDWTMLPYFAFTATEVATKSGCAVDQVERILAAFTLADEDRNGSFVALQDFNAVSATPLLRMPDGQLLSLQSYGLAEALYEAPFYWMTQDKPYLPTLAKNRGDFTEAFVAERLALVFGRDRVFANVDVRESKASKAGEIDVLVIWGDRAIVVQTKSKRLTLEARKGNDKCIRDDFRNGVQDAYDQAVFCAQCLDDERYTLTTVDGAGLALPYKLQEIYVFCVVSDHYPALSFQALQFLKTVEVVRVQPPLVMDVFALDAMTEMLQSPLQFLSYVNRRANYSDQLLAAQELTILGYHLKQNLWIESDVRLLHLGDDLSAGLDLAMAVRRAGVPGAATPDGILTRFGETTLGRVVTEIEARPEPATINLGFMLLTLGEDTVRTVSHAIDRFAERSRADGRNHDMSLGLGTAESGLTVHCNDDPAAVAGPRLESHCERRKYTEKASSWFGLCMSPRGPSVRFGVSLTYPWAKSAEMDEATKDMKPPEPIGKALARLFQGKRQKVGRNDACPCGSGLKYKRCCLGKRD